MAVAPPAVLSRPAVPPPIRTRQNIYTLMGISANHPIIRYYRDAIGVMKQGNRIDTYSTWRYQSAIHDYPDLTLDPQRLGDPLRQVIKGRLEPLPADQGTYWRQCQHSSWFFLPWHRMYLHHFEKIIMGIVVSLGGPPDWALPYWNYSRSGQDKLPEPFRLPGVASNHLWVSQRLAAANSGASFFSASDISLNCLTETVYPETGVDPGFGGSTGPQHQIGSATFGSVESAPHNTVHGRVGGARGWMTFPASAPLDPIFWLHHSNIDRLWEVWIKRGNSNPTTANWLTNQSFPFHDATGARVDMTSSQVVDTKAAPLSYIYDDYNP